MHITVIALFMLMASPSTPEQGIEATEAWKRCVDHHAEAREKISIARAERIAQQAMAACKNEERIVAEYVRGQYPQDPGAAAEFIQLLRDTMFALTVEAIEK